MAVGAEVTKQGEREKIMYYLAGPNRLVISLLTEQQAGSIIIPDSVEPSLQRGKVEHVGPVMANEVPVAKVGDIILFERGEDAKLPNGQVVIGDYKVIAIEVS